MKKGKSSKDLFDTMCWFHAIIDDPYHVFATALEGGKVFYFRRLIRKLFQYVDSGKIYSEKTPSEILFQIRLLCSVIKAAHELRKIKSGPIKVSENNLFDKNYFCSTDRLSHAWNEFPRTLSLKEYCNPYLVMRNFFKYQDLDSWLEVLRDIGDYALSKFTGEYILPDTVRLYTNLLKLVEAAHLINIREVTHIGGHLKNRFVNE